MNRTIFTTLLGIAFIGANAVHAQNGFAVWAEGGDCERQLVFNQIKNGEVLEKKAVLPKQIADCWVHISYDGVWTAFCRVDEAFNGKYGKCDYNHFNKWDVYIAKIDNGKNLPAKPIKVAHGYWPSWGDDAYYPDKPKTLYFTHYESKSIKKTIISPDGTFTRPEEYHKFEQSMGTSAHIQMSPDGKFLLYRPQGGMKVYSIQQKMDISEGLSGDNPCWGPRSRYFIRSLNGAFLNTGTSVHKMGPAGVGRYWQGISNDSHYDAGKLWVIGRIGGFGKNGAGSVEFREIDISNNGWKLGDSTTKVGMGTSCDIHIWGPEDAPMNSSHLPMNFKGVDFHAVIAAGAAGLQLIIQSFDPVYSAGLYDMQGRQKALVRMRNKSQNILPLPGIENGMYLVQLNTYRGSALKKIQIIR